MRRIVALRQSFQVPFRYITRRFLVSGVGQLPEREKTIKKFEFALGTHTVKQLRANLEGILGNREHSVVLNGHIHRKPRLLASRSFAVLRDTEGDVIQLLMTPEITSTESFKQLRATRVEDSVSVRGHIQRKKASGNEMDGGLELVVEEFQTLNSSNLDAARLDRLKHESAKSIPAQYRYLQLRTPFYQKALKTRSRVASVVRNNLIERHGFTEVETPLLFKSTPEGAREFLVPTRTAQKFYALPQSPQQYKQILMSSGFTRYFQIAKCFRDEDLRSDRQPEFTQVDMEMAYINNTDQVCSTVESVISDVSRATEIPLYTLDTEGYLQSVVEKSDSLNFPKLNYNDALSTYGIDKPDLRSSLTLKDLSHYFKSSAPKFPVVEVCVLRGAFDPTTKTKLPRLLTDARNYKKRKPYVCAINNEQDAKNWHRKFIEKDVLHEVSGFDEEKLHRTLNLAPGDILAFSDRAKLSYENPTPLGRFRQLAIENYPNKWRRQVIDRSGKTQKIRDQDENAFVCSWVTDFPLFNPIESSPSDDQQYPHYNYDRYESTHHPFTMAKPDDYELLETDPLKVRGEHYDLVINGVEVGGGSRRIHDPDLQTYIFQNILRIENYNDLFGHLLHALSMGCPPHAGIALGFDRLCAMIVGSSSIRDVIAFPKNQSGIDAVVDSPSSVSKHALHGYHIDTL